MRQHQTNMNKSIVSFSILKNLRQTPKVKSQKTWKKVFPKTGMGVSSEVKETAMEWGVLPRQNWKTQGGQRQMTDVSETRLASS